jgi:hypothetical protein
MQSNLIEKDLGVLHECLKQDLYAFKAENANLEFAFESAAKHVPVYLKIVKGHIEQLAKVLELETHNHRSLENADLAEPVHQLMQLFRELDDEDIQLLENLAIEAKTWVVAHELDKTTVKEAANVVIEA